MKSFYSKYKAHFRTHLLLSYPIIIGQIGHVAMGVIDNVMVGKLGKVALAASGASNAVFFLLTIFAIGISVAVAPIVSIAKVNKRPGETASIFWAINLANLLFSFLLVAGLYFFIHNFSWLKQDPEVEKLSISYLEIITWTTPFMAVFMGMKNFGDGLGHTKIAMLVTIGGLFCNVFLNWLLIFGNWGLPELGLDGAGYATLISRILMAIGIFIFITQAKVFKDYLKTPSLSQIKYFIKDIYKTGIPAGFQYFFEVGAFSSAALLAGWIGTKEQAAHNIAISLASLTYMAAVGISSSAAIKVGKAYGRNNRSETRDAGFSAIVLAMVYETFTCLIFILAGSVLVDLYIDEPEVFPIAVKLVAIAGIFQLSDGIQAVALGALRGLKDVNIPTIIALFSYWAIGIPAAYLLAFKTKIFDSSLSFLEQIKPYGTFIGVEGIWYGLTLGLTLSAILLSIRFYNLTKKKI